MSDSSAERKKNILLPAIIAFCLLVLEILIKKYNIQKLNLNAGDNMQLFRFANPDYLYLLLLLPVMVLLYIINEIRKKRALKRLGDNELVMRLVPEMSKITACN